MAGTLRDLITAAARSVNIVQFGEPLSPEVMDVCTYALSTFVDSSSNERNLIYNINEYVFPLTGATSYTLGLGGDWDVPRPMKIETAYARVNAGSPQQVDLTMQPLTVLQYAGIAVKNTQTTQYPFAYYDDNAYPLRTITLFPIGASGADMVLWLREPLIDMQLQAILQTGTIITGSGYTATGIYYNVPLGGGSGTGAAATVTVANGKIAEVVLTNAGTGYAVNDTLNVSNTSVGGSGSGFSIPVTFVSNSLDDPINFPPGYELFFRLQLALQIADEFGKDVGPELIEKANNAKLAIQRLNKQPSYMRGDGCMTRDGKNRQFNWITGGFWNFGNN